MKRISVIIFVFLLFSMSALRADTGKGGGSMPQLQLNMSARVMGMGGAFAAISDQSMGMFYNPAGTAQLVWSDIQASYRTLDFDRRFGVLATSFKAMEEATISLGWIHASDGTFTGRDGEGELTGEDLSWSSNVVGIAFARSFGKYIYIGALGKYHITKLVNMTSNTVSFDIGGMATLNRKNTFQPNSFFDELRVGLVVKNLAGIDRWNTGDYWGQYGGTGVATEDKHPIAIKGGISALFLDRSILVAADIEKYEEQDVRIFVGGEYIYDGQYSLRGGYADGRMTLGGGLVQKFVYYSLSFDYAFASGIDGEAANHLFTIGFAFK